MLVDMNEGKRQICQKYVLTTFRIHATKFCVYTFKTEDGIIIYLLINIYML